jgi:hypothetical protein
MREVPAKPGEWAPLVLRLPEFVPKPPTHNRHTGERRYPRLSGQPHEWNEPVHPQSWFGWRKCPLNHRALDPGLHRDDGRDGGALVTKTFPGKALRILASPALFLRLIHVPPDRVYTAPVVTNDRAY